MSNRVVARIRIKMCGTTRQEDVSAAVAAGVDALGFIFVPGSPRQVSVGHAASLIQGLPPFVARVGVFCDVAEEEVKQTVDGCGLNQVQLHGNESPAYCRRLQAWRRSLSVSKAFRISHDAPVEHLDRYAGSVDSVLLDSFVKGIAGGTGKSFDWSLVRKLSIPAPLILAGGLRPENVVSAIEAVRPYAIDVNSGVESAPGQKDVDALIRLINNVRRFEARIGLD